MIQDLSKMIATTRNARLRIRLLAVSHFVDGKNRTEISNFLKVSRTSVNNWIKTYLEQGLSGLQEKKHPGRRRELTEKQLVQLKSLIIDLADKADGGRLSGKAIQACIFYAFNVKYQKTNIYHLLHQLDLSKLVKGHKSGKT